MVLHYVANRAGFIVESAASLHAEIFRHGDLHTFDVVAIPERLHKRVDEPENHNVVHGTLAQIVVNAKDAGFGEGCMKNSVQFLCRGKAGSEGLLDNHTSIPGRPRFR